jgi:hypothetical protein
MVMAHLRLEVGHARGGAGTLEAAGMNGHPTRVIASVLEALQALHEDWNDVAAGNGADDATHEGMLLGWKLANGRGVDLKFLILFFPNSTLYFI